MRGRDSEREVCEIHGLILRVASRDRTDSIDVLRSDDRLLVHPKKEVDLVILDAHEIRECRDEAYHGRIVGAGSCPVKRAALLMVHHKGVVLALDKLPKEVLEAFIHRRFEKKTCLDLAHDLDVVGVLRATESST